MKGTSLATDFLCEKNLSKCIQYVDVVTLWNNNNSAYRSLFAKVNIPFISIDLSTSCEASFKFVQVLHLDNFPTGPLLKISNIRRRKEKTFRPAISIKRI